MFGHWSHFFRPFVNIFSAGSSELNHKSPIAIPGKKIKLKVFCSVLDLERICFWLFVEKFPVWFLIVLAMCPQEHFEEDFFDLLKFSQPFRIMSKTFAPSLKKFSTGGRYSVLRDHGKSWWSFLFEKIFFSIVFGRLVIIRRPFVKSFR